MRQCWSDPIYCEVTPIHICANFLLKTCLYLYQLPTCVFQRISYMSFCHTSAYVCSCVSMYCTSIRISMYLTRPNTWPSQQFSHILLLATQIIIIYLTMCSNTRPIYDCQILHTCLFQHTSYLCLYLHTYSTYPCVLIPPKHFSTYLLCLSHTPPTPV